MIDTKTIQQQLASGNPQKALTLVDKNLQSALNSALDSLSSKEEQQVTKETLLECYYLKAVCLRLLKRFNDAIPSLQALLQINAEHARAHQELGYNYRALTESKLAMQSFYQATQLNPVLLTSWQALLPYYTEQRQTQAIDLCQGHIKRLLALPKPLLGAMDLFHDGKIDAAEKLCLNYLQSHKHSLPALMLLADIATSLKAITQAEFILETCVALAPDDPEPKYALFKVYSKLGKFKLGLALAEALITLDSTNVFYHIAKASAQVSLGEIDSAISIYQDIINDNKANANLYVLLGHAYKTKGDTQLSISAYQQAYHLEAAYGDAYWSLANTKTYRFEQAEFEQMSAAIEAPRTSLNDRIHLHFALGKAYEDIKRFDKSFSHYHQGNEIKRASINYSRESHTQFIDKTIANFTPSFAAKLSGMGSQSSAPIFIVGLPRAGSTLLEQILASHSQVDGTMELHEILGMAAKLSKQSNDVTSYPQNIADVPASTLKALGEKFIEDTQIYRAGAVHFIDKMPNNFMHIGLIKTILPNCKIIDARRAPMACCFSGYKQLFGDGQEFSYSLSDIGKYYQDYMRLMDHWHAVYPNQILTVQHEALVADTEAQVKEILAYCGLPFEVACLAFYKNKRAVNTPSAEQVRQPIYTSGLEQWKNYAPYLDELTTLGFHSDTDKGADTNG